MKKNILKTALIIAGLALCMSPVMSFAEETEAADVETTVEAFLEIRNPETGMDGALETASLDGVPLEDKEALIEDNNGEEIQGEEFAGADAAPEVSVSVRLNTQEHLKYMDGSSNGLFYPDAGLSRAEAAKMLYSLLEQPEEGDLVREYDSFSDVKEDDWYAPYVKAMYRYGIMTGYADGSFQPQEKVTRAQFVKMLEPFVEKSGDISGGFSDVSDDFWAAEAIAAVSECGVIFGYPDGTFRPYDTVTRGQAAVMLNRLLGRHGDENIIYDYNKVRMYPDLSTDHWAYADIMEASVPHEYAEDGGELWTSYTKEPTKMTPGYNVVNGALYYVDPVTADFVRSRTIENHYFAYDGKYTTGNQHLDDLVRGVTRTATTSQMTQHQMLRALFNYEVLHNTYLKRDLLEVGQIGWEEAYAVPFFENGKGNCYSFAAAFYYLAKNIGYDPKTVSGLVGHNRRPHGWVEIQLDGAARIYDTELTMAKRAAGNSGIDLFEMTYENAVYVYAKS